MSRGCDASMCVENQSVFMLKVDATLVMFWVCHGVKVYVMLRCGYHDVILCDCMMQKGVSDVLLVW